MKLLANSLLLMVFTAFFALPQGCSTDKAASTATTPTSPAGPSYRYFDRELYFPTGSSVSPEVAAAQALIQASLTDLQNKSSLGQDYFIYDFADDSLLQPVVGPTSYQGRNWRSFFQVWEDQTFNDFAAANVGAAKDQDLIVALNKNNSQQYFIIARLSCFVAGAACNFATQGQAKAMIWRAFGYLVGMRNGDQANSAIMQAGESPAQEADAEAQKYLAAFNGTLERMKNNVAPPAGSNGSGGTPSVSTSSLTDPGQF